MESTKLVRELLDALHEEGDIRMKDKERQEALNALGDDITAACIVQPEFRRLARMFGKRSSHLKLVASLFSSQSGNVPKIDLSNSKVTFTVLSGLCPYIMYLSSNLVSLNLSRNPLGVKGAKALGDALVYNNSIQYLELASCRLVGSPFRPTYDGVLSLSKGISSTRSKLRFLDVSSNSLTPNGIRIICSAISFHPSVTALDISANGAGDFGELEGTMALVTLLTCQKRLSWLSLASSPFNHKGSHLLKDALRENKTLTHLDLTNCDIDRVSRNLFQDLPSVVNKVLSISL